MFEIHNDLLFVVDEVIDDISACLFMAKKLDIDLKFVKKTDFKGNLSICVFRLQSYTYKQLDILENCLKDILKNKDTQFIRFVFPVYVFLNKRLSTANVFFTEGAIVYKKFFNRHLFVVDCVNGNYSMAQKSLNQHHIKNYFYKQYQAKDDSFLLSHFIISKNFDEEQLLDAISDLKNTFYILNKQKEFENFVSYMERTYKVQIRRKSNGEKETNS